MKHQKFSYIFIFFLAISNILSQEIKFYGEAKAGGIIIGQGKNIKAARLNEKPLIVDKSGTFIFGFDRNAKGSFTLNIKLTNKKTLKYEYEIEKRDYGEQSLVIQKKYIRPPKRELKRIKNETRIIKTARKKIGKVKTALYSAGFSYPLDSIKVTGNFGVQRILNNEPHNIHNGVDFEGAEGDSVYAITDGIVRLAGENFYYNGNFVLLDHGQGLSSIYLHLSKIFVKKNQKVKKGELIGLVGSTGRSTSPHLHLGVQWFNKRIDPMSLFDIKELN
ncbi:M23 family metallopeptidase [Rosettibacter firmus]|uniref:M23 family metallopeptidase n=1 Tax=Rosettibacter firmus TaxID=3111522 RepID=UPI00336C13E5